MMNSKVYGERGIWLLVIALLALVVACTPAAAGQNGGEEVDLDSLMSTDWDLVSIGEGAPLAGSKPTIAFAEDGFSGSTGCNGFFGDYTLEGADFSVGMMGNTEMWCEGLMEQEQTVLSMLREAQSLELDGERLVIHTAQGDLVYEPAAHASLEGTSWVLSGISQGEALVSTWLDSEITAEFKEGRMAGSAGCNQYFASYETDGAELTLGPAGSTRMMCDEERSQRETEFLAALSDVAGYEISRDTLTLSDIQGNALLTFQAQD